MNYRHRPSKRNDNIPRNAVEMQDFIRMLSPIHLAVETDNNYPEARLIRSEALKWWGLLTENERIIYCEAHNGFQRDHKTLTGREIENIYTISKQ